MTVNSNEDTGAVAQLGERSVRNAEVVGSNPMRSTITLRGLGYEITAVTIVASRTHDSATL